MTPTPDVRTLPFDPGEHLLPPRADVLVIDGVPYPIDSAQCASCGQRLSLTIDGDVIRVSEPCPYPDGITTVVTVAFPSGKIIVTDDLRPVYNGFDDDEGRKGFASYNCALGQHQVALAYAAQGCAFGPVGNSCPALYRTGPSSYVIASVGWDDGEQDDDDDEPPAPRGWEQLAWVCTDLWAYSIADYDAWVARGGSLDEQRGHREVIAFPSGTYQFTHHTGERGFDGWAAGIITYANIEKVS